RADCPYYAKAELLADYLHKSLPCFHVHKMTQHPEDWEDWLKEVCKKNGWSHQRSPIIWRELVDRGGKGMLVGGFNEFFEHSQEYYNITFDLMSDLMKQIAVENLETHIETKKEQEEIQSLFDPLHVWITSATVPTCYNLIPHLASGDVFGMGKEIWLHLLDSNHDSETLRALVMEAEDLAFPLLRKITVHKIASDAFLQADVVIFLDDTYAKNDLSQEQCLRKIAEQFTQYGALIDQSSNKEVKVVVAGSSYVNLKALILLSSAPSINTHNIVALPTQLEFEAKAQIAKKLNINSSAVKDVILWGNISGINYLDLSHAKIFQYDSAIWGPPSFFRPLKNLIYDRKWLKNEFLQERSRKSQHRSGMSAAHCIATVLSWWQKDSNPEEIVSLGVVSEGQFGLPEGIIYSMPVQFKNGVWHIYAQAVLPSQEKLIEAAADLIKEKEIALGIHQKTEIAIDGSKETTKCNKITLHPVIIVPDLGTKRVRHAFIYV
ncbi:hypothetical protein GDO86_017113, partial [Hymenochirus boettgeri]